jgi:hypothetical protein
MLTGLSQIRARIGYPFTQFNQCARQDPSAAQPVVDGVSAGVAARPAGGFASPDATKSRSTVARFGVIGVSLFLLFGTTVRTASWGATLHFYLLVAGLSLAVGPALQISVGLFEEERQQQALELLYLTGMGPVELFAGKLLSAVLVSSSELMALAPLVAVPF